MERADAAGDRPASRAAARAARSSRRTNGARSTRSARASCRSRRPAAGPARGDDRRQAAATDARRLPRPPSCRRRREAWRRGLRALDAEAQARHGAAFHALTRARAGCAAAARRSRASCAIAGVGRHAARRLFFSKRLLPDIVRAYYAHPDCLERDRLRRAGQPARLCADGLRPPRSLGGGRGQARRRARRARDQRAVSADPQTRAARPRRPRAGCVPAPAAGCRCANIATTRRRFRHRRHRRRRRHAGLPAGRGGLFGRRPSMPGRGCGRSRISPPTRRSRTSSTGPTSASSTAQSAAAGRQQQRQGGRRQHGPFRDGVAALPAGMVQVAQPARLWRRLAARLARDVALLRRGRAGAEDLRPGRLSLGTEAAALSLSRARAQRRRAGAGARRRGARASTGRRRRSPRCRRRAASRRLASIAASASSAARPTPSRARW